MILCPKGEENGLKRPCLWHSLAQVFFHPEEDGTVFVQLRGEPCGGVWGKPIDVDASSRAIWVVCQKEPLGPKAT